MQEDFDTGLTLQEIIDADNIADLLEESILQKISSRTLELFNKDKTNAEYQKRISELDRICKMAEDFPRDMENITDSTVKYPLIYLKCRDFSNLCFPAIMGDGFFVKYEETVFKFTQPAQPQEPIDTISQPAEKATRATQFMNAYLKENSTYINSCRHISYRLPLLGYVIRKVYFDPEEGINFKLINPKDIILSDYRKLPKDCERISEEYKIPLHNLIQSVRLGIFKVDEKDLELLIKAGDDEVKIIEIHCRLDLDDDDYSEPYIVFCLDEVDKIIAIEKRFRADDVHYRENKKTKDNVVVGFDEYIHYYKFEYNTGFEGKPRGLGDDLISFQQTAQASLRLALSAGAKNNFGGGLFNKDITLEGGKLTLEPDEFLPVNVPVDFDLNKAVHYFQRPEMSPVNLQILQFIVDMANQIGGYNIDFTQMSPNQPATTTLAQVEQAMREFGFVMKSIYQTLKEELKFTEKLIKIHLADVYHRFFANDKLATVEDLGSDAYEICPSFDQSILSNSQRLAKINLLMGFANPQQPDPFIDPVELRKLIAKLSQIEGFDKIIVSPTPPQADPLQEALVKAQIKQTEAQAEGLTAQAEDIRAKVPYTAEDMKAEISGKHAKAFMDTASAKQKLSEAHTAVKPSEFMQGIADYHNKNADTRLKHQQFLTPPKEEKEKKNE
jgi:hypothetical protein